MTPLIFLANAGLYLLKLEALEKLVRTAAFPWHVTKARPLPEVGHFVRRFEKYKPDYYELVGRQSKKPLYTPIVRIKPGEIVATKDTKAIKEARERYQQMSLASGLEESVADEDLAEELKALVAGEAAKEGFPAPPSLSHRFEISGINVWVQYHPPYRPPPVPGDFCCPLDEKRLRLRVIFQERLQASQVFFPDPFGIFDLNGPKGFGPVDDEIHFNTRPCPPEIESVFFA